MRHVTLRQLRMFAALARTGSVSKAAEAMHVSPPAVTMQLRLLEEQLGLPLSERASGVSVPTDAGRELIAAIERVETILAECGAALAGLAEAKGGSVSVGVVSTAKYFAPRALAAFAEAHPQIELRLAVGNRAEIIEGLHRYTIEVAVMGRPPQELNAIAEPIGEHPHVIVVPPGHPLVERDLLEPFALAGETFLVREPGSGTRSLMERFFAESGVSPKIGMQISSNETIKQAVMAGLGIAFLSGHTIAAEIASQRLIMLPVRGLPVMRQWFSVHVAPRRLMPAALAVNRFLIERGREFLPLPGLRPFA